MTLIKISPHPLTPKLGSKVKYLNFAITQSVLNIFLGWGSKGQVSTFSEHGHVAYKIKGNHICSNMVANILPSEHPPCPNPWTGDQVNMSSLWDFYGLYRESKVFVLFVL